MIDNEKHIDDLFKNAFDGASQTPPEKIWQNIEKQLDESSVDAVFKNTFSNSRIEPPSGLWSKIQTKLWMRDFMRFSPNKINIYYTSIVAVLAGLMFSVSNNQTIELPLKDKNTIVNKPFVSKANDLKKKSNLSNSNISTQNTKSNSIQDNEIIQSENLKQKKQNTSDIAEIKANSGIKFQETTINGFILGDSVVCVGSEHIYEFACDQHPEIKWSVTPKNATIEQISKNKISLVVQKSGIYKIVTECSKNKTVELQIRADESQKPTISGNQKICEGTQAQYKINNAKYIGKMYAWDLAINPYTNVTGGVILVDCKYPGYDTVSLRDINTKTGCNNIVKYPIIIFPKPDADFRITDNGDGNIELANTSKCGQKSLNCKQSIRWMVNDQSYTKNNITVEFTENGIYSAILEVQNEFNCQETIKKDITIDIQNLFVPNAFAPGSDNLFIPKGENLASYKIEIFDSQNKKLWESTLLTDGKPAEGWNGQQNGELMPDGTYFWKISATFKDGTKWKGVKQKGKYQTFGTFILLNK